MNLIAKTLVVTGAGAGIGRATVLELLRRGARVAAVDLNAEGLQQTADAASAGDRLSLHTVDISDRDAVAALPEEVAGAHGTVDGIVNIAGIIQPFVPVEDLELERMQKVMDVNFWGTVHMVRAFLPGLKTRPAAAVVNVASMGALLPVPGQSAYGASKAAVDLLTKGLYAELTGTSVAVSVVYPGAVGTEISKNSGVEMSSTSSSDSQARTTSPETAGTVIADTIERGKFRVMIGKDAKLFDLINRVAPQRGIAMIAKKMQGLLTQRVEAGGL